MQESDTAARSASQPQDLGIGVLSCDCFLTHATKVLRCGVCRETTFFGNAARSRANRCSFLTDEGCETNLAFWREAASQPSRGRTRTNATDRDTSLIPRSLSNHLSTTLPSNRIRLQIVQRTCRTGGTLSPKDERRHE
jgi:hypothetical protein